MGITNDDAQSFILDDANIFSFDRFSGSDRQETGLRVNYGAHWLTQFDNGSWFDLIAGHSTFLAGTNAFTYADPALTGTVSGLDTTYSYLVAGTRMGIAGTFDGQAKAQFDPNTLKFTRANANASLVLGDVTISGDYTYQAANPALGQLSDQQDAGGRVAVTIDDYWTLAATAGWDIARSQLIDHSLSLNYNDGYLLYGLSYTAKGTDVFAPTDQRIAFNITLRGPDSKILGTNVGINEKGETDFGLDF